MARVLHITCPSCGGTVGLAEVERVVKCRYCGVQSVVDGPDIVPEYMVRPTLKEAEARRTLQKFLMDPEFPEGILKNSRFHSAKLYFLPYYEISARRMGTMTVTQQAMGEKKLVREVTAGPRGSVQTTTSWERSAIPGKKNQDTKVVIGDVIRIEPAINLPEWSPAQSDVEMVRSNPAGLLLPADRAKMEKAGKVFDPTISPDQMLNNMTLRVGAQNLQDNTEFAEPRAKRIFYPVWRLKYVYQNRPFGVTLDAVTGKLMAARAPKTDKWRIVWLIVTTAVVAIIAGPILRGIVNVAFLSGKDGHGMDIGDLFAISMNLGAFIFPVILIMLAAALAVIGMGWDQFRYPAEIVVSGRDRSVVRINRPPHTWTDKALEALGKVADSWREGVEENLKQKGGL